MLNADSSKEEQLIGKLIVAGLDAAERMLNEYGIVAPFGIRVFKDSDDIKMNCPQDQEALSDWEKMIDLVCSELKEFIGSEKIYATALVMSLENDDQKGIGMQIGTDESSVLFVYPYQKDGEKWKIEEPMQAEGLITNSLH